MHVYHEVKDMLHKELEDVARQGDISNASLEMIDTLLNSIKNAEKIIMYNRYGNSEYSYDDGYSYARGRRGNVKRDSMGRYARDDGYSQDGYANRRGEYSREGYSNRYSYADDKEDKIARLEEMMHEANDESEKSMIRSLINRVRNS